MSQCVEKNQVCVPLRLVCSCSRYVVIIYRKKINTSLLSCSKKELTKGYMWFNQFDDS